MKKVFVVLLMALSVMSFAQNVEDIDGFDWVTMSGNEKTGYIVGFYSGLSTIWEWMYWDAGGPDAPPEVLDRLRRYFLIDMTIDELVSRLDQYYSDFDEREYMLNDSILWIIGKDYWNSSKFQEHPSEGEGET